MDETLRVVVAAGNGILRGLAEAGAPAWFRVRSAAGLIADGGQGGAGMGREPMAQAQSSGVTITYDADGTRVVSRLLPTNEEGQRLELVHRIPDAIEHLYPPRPIEDGPLFAGKIGFTKEPNQIYDAQVVYRWAPRPRIDVHGTRPAASSDLSWFEAASRAGGMWSTLPGIAITAR
ncbi:hypothetical protein ACWCPM_23885 [Streptomyces sp. NPDC002309]